RPRGQATEVLQRILVRVLRMDHLSLVKRERSAVEPNDLRLSADQVHLDPLLGADIVGPVREEAQVEVGGQLAVDPRQQVEVELGADSPPVVVGGPDDRLILIEVEADQESAAVPDETSDRTEQTQGRPGAEIA